MMRIAWRWMTATWQRGIVCLLASALFLAVSAIAWREFCLWRVQSCLVIRDDQLADLWLQRSFESFFPDVRVFLVRCKLARRSGNFLASREFLDEAEKRRAPVQELKRERDLNRAQTLHFDSFSKDDWANLIADPRDDEPEIAKAYITWANSRFKFEESAKMLKVWELDYPTDPDPEFIRGQVYSGMSNWEAAESCLRRSLKLAPNRADVQASLASALKQQFRLEEAIHWYRESLRNRPDSNEVKLELAQTLLTNGDFAAARRTVDEALKNHAEDLDLLQILGEILLAEGNSRGAIEPLRRVYASRPESASLAYILASALQAEGHPDEAKPLFAFVNESREPLSKLQSLNEQMVKSPEDLEVRYQIGAITAKYSSRTAAKRWFQNLLRIAPENRPTHLALAEIYQLTGDIYRAREHREAAAALSR